MTSMEFSKFGKISLLCLFAASAMTSCNEEPLDPDFIPHEAYIVQNKTSSHLMSVVCVTGKHRPEIFLRKGDECTVSVLWDEERDWTKTHPDAVSCIISLPDSAIEIVPSLASTDSCHNAFSGLEEWYTTSKSFETTTYQLKVTDEVLRKVADRMRGKGLPPFRITKEVIANNSQYDAKISTKKDGKELISVFVPKNDSVVLPKIGAILQSDEYVIEIDGKSRSWDVYPYNHFDTYPIRFGRSGEGYRKYVLTDYMASLTVDE